jgi:hypothetical protein
LYDHFELKVKIMVFTITLVKSLKLTDYERKYDFDVIKAHLLFSQYYSGVCNATDVEISQKKTFD